MEFYINLPNVAMYPFNCCISFKFLYDLMSDRAFIVSGLAFIPMITLGTPKISRCDLKNTSIRVKLYVILSQ